ncbi:MAG: hypothetical protein NC548_65405 [Lachnospiraceae bacterium]|nr:hypothetical protein [Lachnospiraceae bacterium]
MKPITISLYAVERRIDVLDENNDPVGGRSQFSAEDFMEWTVFDDGEETEYAEDDFGDLWDLEDCDELSEKYAPGLDVMEFIEGCEGAELANLETLKSSGSIEIEIPADEKFDPKKLYILKGDWIYPEYEEQMIYGFIYDGKFYDELYPDDGRGIDSEQIWPC